MRTTTRVRRGDGMLARLRPVLDRVPTRLVRRLPAAVAVPWLAHGRGARRHVVDVRSVPVPPPFRLETYWLRSRTGSTGPAASLWVGGEELLRIDGLRGDCHVHYDLAGSRARGAANLSARRRLADDDIAGWAADELRLNLRYSISLQRRALRRLSLEREVLDEAARRVEADFEDLIVRHGDDADG